MMALFNPKNWISAHRSAKEANGMLSRGFATLKIETFASLVQGGMDDKDAAQVVNATFDPEWKRLMDDALFLGSDQTKRVELFQCAAQQCLEALERVRPGTVR